MLQVCVLLAIGVLVGLDQWTKWLAGELWRQTPWKLWDGVFELTYLENRGAAWGIGQGGRWVFVVITSLVSLVIIGALLSGRFRHRKWLMVAGVLIAAGGIGNLIDRVLNGYVVDFLYFRLIDFPVFNVADCCVVIGAALLLIYVLFIYKEPPAKAAKEETDGAGAADGDAAAGGAADRLSAADKAAGDAGDGTAVAGAAPGDGSEPPAD